MMHAMYNLMEYVIKISCLVSLVIHMGDINFSGGPHHVKFGVVKILRNAR